MNRPKDTLYPENKNLSPGDYVLVYGNGMGILEGKGMFIYGKSTYPGCWYCLHTSGETYTINESNILPLLPRSPEFDIVVYQSKYGL